jgi:hypothetical protein
MIIEKGLTCTSTLSAEAKKGNFSNRAKIEEMVELTLKDKQQRFLIQRNGIECFVILPQNPYVEGCESHDKYEDVSILLFHGFQEFQVKK